MSAPGRARLFAKWGPARGVDCRIEGEATIGRAAENTLRLEDRMVSGRHARIAFDADRDAFYLEDLESTNGTLLDGVPVRGRERLERLHVVDFGGSCPMFFVRLPVGETGKASRELESEPLPAAAGAESGVWLEIHEPGGAARRVALEPGETVIGRGADAGIQLASSDVSRRHAVISVAPGRISVRDLGSHNGTLVEGTAVESDAEVALEPPVRLRFGNVEVVVGTGEEGETEAGA